MVIVIMAFFLADTGVAFDFFYQILFSHQGGFEIDFNDMGAIVTTELRATHDGHLYAHLHDL